VPNIPRRRRRKRRGGDHLMKRRLCGPVLAGRTDPPHLPMADGPQTNSTVFMMHSRVLMWTLATPQPMAAWCDDAPPPEDVWTGKGEAGFVAAERWDTLWQSNYDVSKDLFAFGALRYSHDMFSGFQYQASATAGIGYKLIDTDATKLNLQAVITAGLMYSQALTSTMTLSDKFMVESGSSDTLLTNTLALTVKMSTKLALSLGYNTQDNSKPPAGLKKLDSLETFNLVYSF
jgi:hypothetical protein